MGPGRPARVDRRGPGGGRTVTAVADDTTSPWSGSLAVRILLSAAVLLIALSILGWIIGVVISVVRALVVLAAVLAVAWLAVRAIRR